MYLLQHIFTQCLQSSRNISNLPSSVRGFSMSVSVKTFRGNDVIKEKLPSPSDLFISM